MSAEVDIEELLSRHPIEIGRAIDKMLSKERLVHFIEAFWPFVEPGREFKSGWVIDAICEHLEAVTSGEIKRLLMNVPPGMMKSLTSNVFWPAWEWGPLNMPSTRYLCASYSQTLTIRDNGKFRNVISSDLYRAFWGDQFAPAKDQFNIIKVGNDRTGWKLASSIGGVGTGERGDRVILDDPNSVQQAESEAVRLTTNRWFLEVMPSRLNDLATDAIVIIQQRTNEDDVSGVCIARELGYEHLMIPMRYDQTRHCVTVIGWQDPRGLDSCPKQGGNNLFGPELEARDGMLAFPERFKEDDVKALEKSLGPYATAGQLQQMPGPRGGGIFRTDWWQPYPPADWPPPENTRQYKYPDWSYVVAALDTALTEKEENDFSALTIWGVWHSRSAPKVAPKWVEDPNGVLRMTDDDQPKVMLIHAWQKRLALHGPPEYRPEEMSPAMWNSSLMLKERQQNWGLMEWVIWSCKMYGADTLIIEDKAAGHTVHQEMARMNANQRWTCQLVDPRNQDKVARAYSVQHLFSNGLIYVPHLYDDKDDEWRPPPWADAVMTQMKNFPKASHDDLTDSAIYALRHLRDIGVLLRRDEAEMAWEDEMTFRGRRTSLYEA